MKEFEEIMKDNDKAKFQLLCTDVYMSTPEYSTREWQFKLKEIGECIYGIDSDEITEIYIKIWDISYY